MYVICNPKLKYNVLFLHYQLKKFQFQIFYINMQIIFDLLK